MSLNGSGNNCIRWSIIDTVSNDKGMNEYEVEYWILTGPIEDYDNRYIKVKADSESEALEKAKQQAPKRAKRFSIWKKDR